MVKANDTTEKSPLWMNILRILGLIFFLTTFVGAYLSDMRIIYGSLGVLVIIGAVARLARFQSKRNKFLRQSPPTHTEDQE